MPLSLSTPCTRLALVNSFATNDENRDCGCRSTQCAFGIADVSLGTKTAASMLRQRSVHKRPLSLNMPRKMEVQLARQAAYLQTSKSADLLAEWEAQ